MIEAVYTLVAIIYWGGESFPKTLTESSKNL